MMLKYAGMVELVDSVDLGDVTSGKVFLHAADKGKSRLACFYKLWIKHNAPPRVPPRVKIRGTKEYAGVVELVDSVDLGSSGIAVQVRVLSPAPTKSRLTAKKSAF